jgi:DNA modification methylase
MPLWYDSPTCAIFHGDALTELRGLGDGVVNCCVTSPPYWGLRDYKADGQLGLEKTPEEYIAKMVAAFREVRRVLRSDGTLWLNIGDSYNSGASGGLGGSTLGGGQANQAVSIRNGRKVFRPGSGRADGIVDERTQRNRDGVHCEGLKPKDLVGIPWALAFALRADGWWLRQDIIWSKNNSMPESVTDRCTKSHEYIFLLTKSPHYYFDQESIKEPSAACDPRRPYTSQGAWEKDGRPINRASTKPRTAGNKTHKLVTEYEHSDSEEHRTAAGLMKISDVPWETRNKRDVWTVATAPFKDAHFAVFPPKLIEPCILAGCPPGGLVLDPFAGSGTTLMVANQLGRRAIGIELQPDYLPMIQRRIQSIKSAKE